MTGRVEGLRLRPAFPIILIPSAPNHGGDGGVSSTRGDASRTYNSPRSMGVHTPHEARQLPREVASRPQEPVGG